MSWQGYGGGGYPGGGGHPGGGYGGGYGGGGGGGGYDRPPQPPPQQWQQNHYAQPPHPPSNHYNPNPYGAAPPGPPPSHPGQYRPPNHPPPQGLDPYGYPLSSRPAPNYNQGYGGPPRGGRPPPADAPQQFGHGAPEGYTFQYSNCTGKRKALCIGINYIGQEGELRGCINDVHNISSFLMERYNYKREDMIFLTDDNPNPQLQPTKANILRAMGWLVQGARANDSLFLHYSGHGGRTEDLDGDEDDGYDETIYPVDHLSEGMIIDDQIHDVVVKPLLPGVRLTAIFDSCHSGTAMDLPYVYSTKGVLKEPNLAAEAGQGLLSAVQAYAQGDMGGVAKSIMGFAKTAMQGTDGYKKTIATKTSPADVIMWSGSKDDQTSADANIAQKATGAMSWAFIKAIKANPNQSYVELLNSIRDLLEENYSQKPQLSCSHPLGKSCLPLR